MRWNLGIFVCFWGALACTPEGGEKSSGSDDDSGASVTTDDTGEATTEEGPVFEADAELERLLIGFFDSSTQSGEDPSYYHIMLTMCPVSVPELGERVLYVEQTSADTPNNPYRQRLYRIEPGASDTQAVSRVYELAGPGAFIGACDNPDGIEFEMDRVLELEGCDVILDWDGSQFVGGTVGDACATDFGGATYATSEIALNESLLVSWDRGYDDRGRQVWGAVDGGYEFVRHTDIGSW